MLYFYMEISIIFFILLFYGLNEINLDIATVFTSSFVMIIIIFA